MGKDRSDEVRAVDRGVKLLDKENPYWAMGLGDIGDYFDINDKRCCVLGSAYGRFERGFYKLTGHVFNEDNPDDIKWAIDHGFWVKDDSDAEENYFHGREQYMERSDRLTKSWLKRIKARVERIEKASKFGSGKLA